MLECGHKISKSKSEPSSGDGVRAATPGPCDEGPARREASPRPTSRVYLAPTARAQIPALPRRRPPLLVVVDSAARNVGRSQTAMQGSSGTWSVYNSTPGMRYDPRQSAAMYTSESYDGQFFESMSKVEVI